MPGLVHVNDATHIWATNIYWPLNAQCAVWDPRGKVVNVWECVRPRELRTFNHILSHHLTGERVFLCADNSTPDTEPPNNMYWRYVARR